MSRFLLPFLLLISTLSASYDVLPWIEKYPEILWLADDNVRKTEEGEAAGLSHSEQLFGKKFIEFDRTIMTLRCLHLLLDGSDEAYDLFTSAQPSHDKLTKNSFISLNLEAKALVQSAWGGLTKDEIIQALETSLVLGDIGKSEKARELFRPLGIEDPDHDDFYGEVMKVAPLYCPSFIRLPESGKKLLKKTANLAHYGHLFHLEGNASMYRKLQQSQITFEDPIALAFDLFVHTCDVAGAQGHINNSSSLSYREKTHIAEKSMERAVWSLSDPKASEWEAYDIHLTTLANWLGLDPIERAERAITRAGAMLRLYTAEEGCKLKEAFLLLDENDREEIIQQLDCQADDVLARTPTYMPVVLLNLSNKLGLEKAILIGLPFIANVLKHHREDLRKGLVDPTIPLNFNKMGQVAKNNPEFLQGPFFIDEEGNVLLGCFAVKED